MRYLRAMFLSMVVAHLLMVSALNSRSARKTSTLTSSRARRAISLSGNCVVWHSQHKSGGNTISKVLRTFPLKAKDENCSISESQTYTCDMNPGDGDWADKNAWNCDRQTCDLTELLSNYKQGLDECGIHHVAYKGYTPVLVGSEWGSPGDGNCVWASLAREPVSRLVSAFLYCRERQKDMATGEKERSDPLCGLGSSSFDFNAGTIQDFAEYWGNYLFRELMWHPELHALAASRNDFVKDIDCKEDPSSPTGFPPEQGPQAPWQIWKGQLNGGDDPRTQSGADNLEAVERYLKNGKIYDIVGLLENYDDTMELFDRWMPLANDPWHVASKSQYVSHGSEEWATQEANMLKQASKDSRVLNAIRGDIRLYNDVIKPLFYASLKK